MKKIFLSAAIVCAALLGACQKSKTTKASATACSNPSAPVSAALQGNWMYGNFSMTEYWTQNPADYLGNALQFAIAFKFNADGTYEQYFTSSSVTLGVVTYQQSVSKGTVVIDETNKTVKTYCCTSRYKRTKNGHVEEERDLNPSEITTLSTYNYTTGTEPNGTKAIYLTIAGTTSQLKFLQKF
ncbi:hypothetical protein [Ferruginibacter sp.]